VQWARELLEYLLREVPEKILAGEQQQVDLGASPGDAALVAWSGRLLERVFVEEVQALLRKHPATAIDEATGVPFWTGKKRVPRLVDARHELFVRAHIEVLAQLRAVFDEGTPLQPVEFDKDDDSNGQIDCIHALTNLRAFVYDIPSTDRATCRHIAGKIIPAISCTTSAVAGRAVSEIFHLRCTNMFMNLGLNLYLESEAGPPLKIQSGFSNILQAEVVALPGPHTCWDRHMLASSHQQPRDQTLGDLKTRMENDYPLARVTSISSNNEMLLYSEFMDVTQKDAVLSSKLKGDQFQIDGETDEGDIVIFPIVVLPKFQAVPTK
jgi:hypothetical protein